jgi:branched-chain amino acid transport system permease protein
MVGSVIGHVIAETLVLGTLYAVVGVGFVILFRSTGVVNFAQGTFMVLGAYIFYTMYVVAHQDVVLSVVVSLIAITVLGAAVNTLMFRRLIGADLFIVVVATMGLSLTLQTIALTIWGPDVRVLPHILPGETFIAPFGVPFDRLDLLTMSASVVLVGTLIVLLRKSRLGLAMRAVADSTLLAALQRVNVSLYSGIAWAIAGLCSALAGVALAVRTAVDPTNIGSLGLLIFPVVIIGGVDSIGGALVGGLIVAAIQQVTNLALSGSWVNPIAYGLLLLMLLVKPRGLFGTREIVRV